VFISPLNGWVVLTFPLFGNGSTTKPVDDADASVLSNFQKMNPVYPDQNFRE
jgi:hypothetical protein